MTARCLASLGLVGTFAGLVLLSGFIAAQTRPAAAQTPQAKTYVAPRTTDGRPDLQGYWSNTTYTPLQRPDKVTKEFYTPQEAEQIAKQAAVEEAEQTVPGTIPDVHYDFTQFGL